MVGGIVVPLEVGIRFMDDTNLIEIKDLHFRRGDRVVFNGLSLTVAAIDIDLEYGEAIVSMELKGSGGVLSTDTGAQILTEGILGARYISLLPGADEETLFDGDVIEDTQGAMVLENLIGDLLTRLGAS